MILMLGADRPQLITEQDDLRRQQTEPQHGEHTETDQEWAAAG